MRIVTSVSPNLEASTTHEMTTSNPGNVEQPLTTYKTSENTALDSSTTLAGNFSTRASTTVTRSPVVEYVISFSTTNYGSPNEAISEKKFLQNEVPELNQKATVNESLKYDVIVNELTIPGNESDVVNVTGPTIGETNIQASHEMENVSTASELDDSTNVTSGKSQVNVQEKLEITTVDYSNRSEDSKPILDTTAVSVDKSVIGNTNENETNIAANDNQTSVNETNSKTFENSTNHDLDIIFLPTEEGNTTSNNTFMSDNGETRQTSNSSETTHENATSDESLVMRSTNMTPNINSLTAARSDIVEAKSSSAPSLPSVNQSVPDTKLHSLSDSASTVDTPKEGTKHLVITDPDVEVEIVADDKNVSKPTTDSGQSATAPNNSNINSTTKGISSSLLTGTSIFVTDGTPPSALAKVTTTLSPESSNRLVEGAEDSDIEYRVTGIIRIVHGARWSPELEDRKSAQFQLLATNLKEQLDILYQKGYVGEHLKEIEIDGFSSEGSVVVMYTLVFSTRSDLLSPENLKEVVKGGLPNGNLGVYQLDMESTNFKTPWSNSPSPVELNSDPPIPQWAIAVIVVAAACLIFSLLFAAVTVYGRGQGTPNRSLYDKEGMLDSPCPEWERKMAAAYENMAADNISEKDGHRRRSLRDEPLRRPLERSDSIKSQLSFRKDPESSYKLST